LAVTLMAMAGAPLLARVFHEPRVSGITAALAVTFTIDALMAQHQALLRRQMRFKTLAMIDVAALISGIVVALFMAWRGWGYWSLVAMQIVSPAVSAAAVWAVEPWRPGVPRRGCGARGMMRFGFFLTGTNALNYFFRNADNVLIGWYWGAGPLGLYTKAYGLLLLPIAQINAPVGGVAVPTLSRLQADPARFRRYFLGGYSVIASAILPVVVTLTIFADEVVRVMLGPQWNEAARLFRLLAPAALIGALLNPLGWLFIALGRPDRQFWLALGWAFFISSAFVLGLPYGPQGVAAGYSLMSCVLALPLCGYATRGAPFGVKDLLHTLVRPGFAILAGGAAGAALKLGLAGRLPALLLVVLGAALVGMVYGFVLLVVLRRWPFYRDLLRELFPNGPAARWRPA
jgi:PST family polysaccharide transporter